MTRFALLALIPLVAACTPSQQACENAALKDLHAIDMLIAETEQNIERGYGVEVKTVRASGINYCFGKRSGGRNTVGVVFCNEPEYKEVEKPISLDIDAEKAKLKSLKAKRTSTAKQAAKDIAICRQQTPAG